jgi:hypothetical protein
VEVPVRLEVRGASAGSRLARASTNPLLTVSDVLLLDYARLGECSSPKIPRPISAALHVNPGKHFAADRDRGAW